MMAALCALELAAATPPGAAAAGARARARVAGLPPLAAVHTFGQMPLGSPALVGCYHDVLCAASAPHYRVCHGRDPTAHWPNIAAPRRGDWAYPGLEVFYDGPGGGATAWTSRNYSTCTLGRAPNCSAKYADAAEGLRELPNMKRFHMHYARFDTPAVAQQVCPGPGPGPRSRDKSLLATGFPVRVDSEIEP